MRRMVLTSSRGVLAAGILLPLGIGGAALYSAWQQMETGSPIPPLSAAAAVLFCFLTSAFLIYTYFIQGKPNATTVRFPVFFVGLLWIICLGVSAESFAGAHLWQQSTAIAEPVTTTFTYGSKGGRIYTDDITYRYIIQEKTFTGHETLRDTERTVNKPLHGNQRLNFGPITAGEEIYIRVNPAYPEQSFIQRRVRYIPFLLFVLSTFLLGRWIVRRAITEKSELPSL